MDAITPDLAGHGVTEDAWNRSPWLRNLPRRSPGDIFEPAQRMVLVSPHPDDEVLGCGGLLHEAGRRALPVLVVAVTDGEACYPGHPVWTPERLRATRRDELVAALAELGVPDLTLTELHLPDSGVAAHHASLVEALATMLRPGDFLLVTWRGDGHGDHEACALATLAAAQQHDLPVTEFPIWAWHWLDPLHGPPAGVEASAYELDPAARDAKARALARFRSQRPHAELGDTAPILPDHITARFQRDFEVLFDSRD